mmetsp:Transcript_16253/g.18775  ORF Transcript_16253/g.18775 Transcript_16253/m.18775 type:complete len:483 (-) Transcript_16253:363-1811(-)
MHQHQNHQQQQEQQKICIINTDNVLHNGTVIRKYMLELATKQDNENKNNHQMQTFLEESVVFHNTMVDRITSQRPNHDTEKQQQQQQQLITVPRAEPIPMKALVIEDVNQILPSQFSSSRILHEQYGVVIRSPLQSKTALTTDIALKLRIANGTHTALAHVMALSGITMTDVLSDHHTTTNGNNSKVLVRYIDSFFHQQIKEALKEKGKTTPTTTTTTNNNESAVASPSSIEVEADAVYEDWRKRLLHGNFGLSTFFITQNGASKGGIRLGPTIRDLIQAGKPITCSTVFAVAALLRFLTPTKYTHSFENKGIYKGWLDNKSIDAAVAATDTNTDANTNTTTPTDGTVVYADGLSYNLKERWYEFRCTNMVTDDDELTGTFDGCTKNLVDCLGSRWGSQPIDFQYNIHLYLIDKECGNLSMVKKTPAYHVFLKAVATVYANMISHTTNNEDNNDGNMMAILKEMDVDANCESLVDHKLAWKY